MGISATHLTLRNFRSYRMFDLEPDPVLTVLVGPNAAGKTNIIEAIQLLTAADSFRKPTWGDLITWGQQESRISLEAQGDRRHLETEMVISESGRRSYKVNGKTKRRVSDVAGTLPCVLFTPDDLRLVKDSSDRRRAAIDGVGDQLSPAYLTTRTEYERIVRQRNALLRDDAADRDVFDTLTEKLAAVGFSFAGHRRRLFERINLKMSEAYGTLSPGESLEAKYVFSWEKDGREMDSVQSGTDLVGLLDDRRSEEIARGTTLVGPHRDEVIFTIDGRNARTFASQGQQRTIALAWKLAEVAVVSEISGQSPLLLLDDVMSELDEARRKSLMSFVGKAAQTFLTTTNIGYFDAELIDRAKVVTLGQ